MNATYNHPTPTNTKELELAARTGRKVSVSRADPATYDLEETGPMFRIEFEDGYVNSAFEDELTF